MPILRPIPEEQAAYERTVIFDMIKTLEQVKEQGYSDWQTLTSFIANLLLDQDNAHKMLKGTPANAVSIGFSRCCDAM